MSVPGTPPARCALEGRAPCPPECRPGEPCAVVRVLLRDGSEWWGVPLGVVGETLRLRRTLPSAGVFLVPLDGIEAGPRRATAVPGRTRGAGS